MAAVTTVLAWTVGTGESSESKQGRSPARPASAASASEAERARARSEEDRLERAERRRRVERRRGEPVEYRRSVAVGTHAAGKLRRGVMLPAEGREWVSWDPIIKRRPSRQ